MDERRKMLRKIGRLLTEATTEELRFILSFLQAGKKNVPAG